MIVVVSPHLDDAVLSVPCWIAERGREVAVLTVFSEGDDAGYAGRRAEDIAACDALGVRAVHLGLRDAPYRLGVERSFRGLVFSEVDARDGMAVGREIAEAVARLGGDVVVLPLGVGEHVDHRVVHAAHAIFGGRVGFYEDRPYADVRHAVRARFARLGASVDGVEVTGSAEVAAEFLIAARAAPHVRAYLAEAEREACLERLAEPLVRPARASGLALRGEQHAAGAVEVARARRAVQAYASQVLDLFGGAEAAAGAYAGAYVERLYWRG